MWRQNNLSTDPLSDQSISDDDDVDASWPEDCISLGGSVKEEGLQLPLRLEKLKGASELNSRGEYRKEGTSLERRVGIPGTSNFDEEGISDEEESDVLSKIIVASRAEDLNTANLHLLGIDKGDVVESEEWSTVIKETKQIRSNVNAPCSSSYSTCFEVRHDYKGLRGKAKPKFSFQNQSKSVSSKQEKNASSSNGIFERLEDTKCRIVEHDILECIEDHPQQEETHTETSLGEDEANHAASVNHSMAELLDGLHDNKHAAIRKLKMFRRKGKRETLLSKNNVSILNRSVDLEGSPEPVDIESSSSDREDNLENPMLVLPEMKRQSMADRFQEIVGAAALNSEEFIFGAANQSGNGLYGNLQKVIRLQKEGDLDFFKKLQIGFDSNCVQGCTIVKILSKYLDGQMTVCECVFIQNEEFQRLVVSQTAIYNESKRTVIFNPRICSNVELEVGNLIRIIPPWYCNYNLYCQICW